MIDEMVLFTCVMQIHTDNTRKKCLWSVEDVDDLSYHGVSKRERRTVVY